MEEEYLKMVDEKLFENQSNDNEDTLKIKEDLKKVNEYFKTQLSKMKEKIKVLEQGQVKTKETNNLTFLDHVIIEKNQILDFNQKNPIKIFKMMKAMADTTWEKMMVNSYQRALQIRGEGHLKYAKIKNDREK